MPWGVSPWVYPVWNSLVFLDLGDYFLPHFRENFNYYLKYFLMVFLFVFFFWDSYDSNVGAFNIVPEVSETVLVSFNTFFFFPLCLIYFYPSIFYLFFSQLFVPSHQSVEKLLSMKLVPATKKSWGLLL